MFCFQRAGLASAFRFYQDFTVVLVITTGTTVLPLREASATLVPFLKWEGKAAARTKVCSLRVEFCLNTTNLTSSVLFTM